MTPVALIARDDPAGLDALIPALLAAGFRIAVAGQIADTLANSGLSLEPLSALLNGGLGLGESFDLGHSQLTGGLTTPWDDPAFRTKAAMSGFLRLTLLVADVPTTLESLGGLDRLNHGPHQSRAHLLRLAATHAQGVSAVVVDPADYATVAEALTHNTVTEQLRATLRSKALAHVAAFDALTHQAHGITPHQAPQQGLVLAPWPVPSTRRLTRLHDPSGWLCGVQPIELLFGPLPNAQTLLSLEAAMQLAEWPGEGDSAASAIHGHACAFSVSTTGVPRAVMRAMGADPAAIDGGVLVCKGRLDITAARALLKHPKIGALSVFAATEITEEAQTALKAQEHLLVLRIPHDQHSGARVQLLSTRFGVFMRDVADPTESSNLRQLGAVSPTEAAQAMVPVAMHTCRQLPGVAVALADDEGSIAVCGGQAHAIDAIQVVAAKARRVSRPCVAVVNAELTRPLALKALQNVEVHTLVVRGLGAESEAMRAAADQANIALLQLPDDWASVHL